MDRNSVDDATGCNAVTGVNLSYKPKAGIVFRKDVFGEIDCWQNYRKRIVYVKQLMIRLVVEKSSSDTPDITTPITIQPRYIATSFQTQLYLQGKTMLFVDPIKTTVPSI